MVALNTYYTDRASRRKLKIATKQTISSKEDTGLRVNKCSVNESTTAEILGVQFGLLICIKVQPRYL